MVITQAKCVGVDSSARALKTQTTQTKTIEANMVAIAKKVGMREKEIRELSEVNAVRRLLAKENAADVLLRLNPISRDAIYKAIEVEHAKLLRAQESTL